MLRESFVYARARVSTTGTGSAAIRAGRTAATRAKAGARTLATIGGPSSLARVARPPSLLRHGARAGSRRRRPDEALASIGEAPTVGDAAHWRGEATMPGGGDRPDRPDGIPARTLNST